MHCDSRRTRVLRAVLRLHTSGSCVHACLYEYGSCIHEPCATTFLSGEIGYTRFARRDGVLVSPCEREQSRDTSVCYASSVVSRVYRERHAVTYPSDDDGDKVTLICMRRERRFYVERAHDVPRVWRAHTVHRDARPRGARVKTAELLRKCVRCLGEIFRENKWRGRRRPKHGPKAGWRLAAAGARASWLAVRVRARSGLLLRLFL